MDAKEKVHIIDTPIAQNQNSLHVTVKAGVWYTATNFLIKGFSFIITPILTRLVTTGEYGVYSNFQSWLSIMMILATGCLHTAINRAQFDYKDRLNGYISSITLLGTLITAACYLIVWIFQDFFTALFDLEMIYIHAMFIYLLVEPALMNLQTQDRVTYRYKRFAVLSLISTVSALLLSVLFALIIENRSFGIVLGRLLPMGLVCLAVYIFICVRDRSVFDRNVWKHALFIAIPLIPHHLSGTILTSSDRIMIQHFCGPEDVAVYSVSYALAQIVSLLSSSVNQAWTPWLLQQIHQDNRQNIREKSKPYFLLFALPCVLFMLLAPEALYIMGGTAYQAAAYVIPPVMLGLVLQFYYFFFVNVEIYFNKSVWISSATIISALTNIVLNFIFIPMYGYIAAAYTTLFSYLLLVLIHGYNVHRLKLLDLYDNRWFILIVTIFTFITALSYPLYHWTVLRYVITGIYALAIALFFLKKKDILLSMLGKR